LLPSVRWRTERSRGGAYSGLHPPGAVIPRASQSKPANLLLAALPAETYRRLLSGLERVNLKFGHVLYETGDTVRHVYFPNDSLISLLVAVEGNGSLEVGMVGREGMVGVPLALGRPQSPVRALVQGGGSAMRMSGKRFASELKKNGGLKRELDRCVFVSMTTAMQVAACNQSHVLAQRLARWLLMVRDRVMRDEFPLTQEFLSRMLGVRRAGVSEAASTLQRSKLISYRRGIVRILDLEGLGAMSCACYGVIRKLENGSR
jgi:CRP-like cAMP-binding protein